MGLGSVLTRMSKARDARIEKREAEADQEWSRFKAKTAREIEQANLVTERSLASAKADKAKATALNAEIERKKAEKELKGEGFLQRTIKELRK